MTEVAPRGNRIVCVDEQACLTRLKALPTYNNTNELIESIRGLFTVEHLENGVIRTTIPDQYKVAMALETLIKLTEQLSARVSELEWLAENHSHYCKGSEDER